MRRIFGNGRYATVTSTLALVVALSGTAYAAATVTSAQIVNNTIQGLDIKAGTVAGSDIKDDTVTSADVAESLTTADLLDGNVLGADLADGTVTASDIAAGTVDSALLADGGVAGDDLADGAVGSAAIANGSVAAGDLAAGVVSPRIFAIVLFDGSLGYSAGISGVVAAATGTFDVTFSQDVSACAKVVTPHGTVAGESAVVENLSSTSIRVRVSDVAGTLIDRGFQLVAVC